MIFSTKPARLEKVFLTLIFFLTFVYLDGVHAELPGNIISKKDAAPMILVPEGEFTYGMNRVQLHRLLLLLKEPFSDFYESEFDEKRTSLRSFYMDKFEVTNARYRRFLEETGHRIPSYQKNYIFNQPDLPVVGIGWNDAEEYCSWSGKRLPSEMEWEKAARGTDRRIWPWGDDPDDKRYNGRKMGNRAPVNVGSFSPAGDSPYGIADMAGNVWEMTSSKWPNEQRPAGMVMKGGSFLNTNADVRAMVRWTAEEQRVGATWLGFRCAKDRE